MTSFLVAWAALAFIALIGLSFGAAYFVGMGLTLAWVGVFAVVIDISR